MLRSWLTAGHLFRRAMEPFFAAFGLTAAQWAVLHTLHRAEQGGETEIRMADLGERLVVRPPSVTTVVQKLQRLGLLVVRRSNDDQRVRCIALTPAGRRTVGRVLERRAEQLDRIFGTMDVDRQEEFRALLEQFAGHLANLVEAEAN